MLAITFDFLSKTKSSRLSDRITDLKYFHFPYWKGRLAPLLSGVNPCMFVNSNELNNMYHHNYDSKSTNIFRINSSGT